MNIQVIAPHLNCGFFVLCLISGPFSFWGSRLQTPAYQTNCQSIPKYELGAIPLVVMI